MKTARIIALCGLGLVVLIACGGPRGYDGSTGSGGGTVSSSQIYRDANVLKRYIPNGRYARRKHRYLRPRYITIHSTQNYSAQADALQHAKALNRGAIRGGRIGYLAWHYSVDETRAVHTFRSTSRATTPTSTDRGTSTALEFEMCENRGNSRAVTVRSHGAPDCVSDEAIQFPIRNVVPHYHWPRAGRRPANKKLPEVPHGQWKAGEEVERVSGQGVSLLPDDSVAARKLRLPSGSRA